MGLEKNYITILKDSLYKKIAILDSISEENKKQKSLIMQENLDLEEMEPMLVKKQEYIDQLNELDDGFQSIYDRVKEELNKHPENYKEEMKEMKELISQITGKSMELQIEEERNKQAIQEHFSRFKKKIRRAKTSKHVATSYYNSMNKLTNVEPQFMDRKK